MGSKGSGWEEGCRRVLLQGVGEAVLAELGGRAELRCLWTLFHSVKGEGD